MTKEIQQLGYDAENNFVSFLKDNGYPEKSIILGYKNQKNIFDIAIIEESSKKISAIFEIKIIENLLDFKEGSDQPYYDQIKKYYDTLEEGVDIYLVVYNKQLQKKIFLTVRHQLFEGYNFLEVKDFPTYRELTGSKIIEIKEEETKKINNNYLYFKIFCRIFGIISLILFFISLRKCEFITGYRHQICSININYPNIIMFIIGIILILISFLKNIKTQRFNINWDEENN